MRAWGIASVVTAGVGIAFAVQGLFEEEGCKIDNLGSGGNCDKFHGYTVGGLISAAVLTGVGLPLIVIGSRERLASPENVATVSPWVGRQGAGLSLRFDL